MKAAEDSAETHRLLQRISRGEAEAFNELFARYHNDLRQQIELRLDRRLRARLDPSDIVQETQLDALRQLDNFLEHRPMPFSLWLRKTAYQRLIKCHEQHIQATRRSVKREILLSDETSQQLMHRLHTLGPSPSQRAAQRESTRRVHIALAQLKNVDREILLMRYVEDLSNGEIGLILDLQPGTVSKRHARALVRLEKLLRNQDINEVDS